YLANFPRMTVHLSASQTISLITLPSPPPIILSDKRFDATEIEDLTKAVLTKFSLSERDLVMLYQCLKRCTSRNPRASNRDALRLSENYEAVFGTYTEISPNMQVNCLRLSNAMKKHRPRLFL
ncbi:hypothetical protein QN363_19865, partial [Undibacterium sp. CCC2.1]|uniref:hypothetical protein n=1 Tax=Undibacterium sp. CCC2.1 TaxID=3048604 RepID=UPI002B224807